MALGIARRRDPGHVARSRTVAPGLPVPLPSALPARLLEAPPSDPLGCRPWLDHPVAIGHGRVCTVDSSAIRLGRDRPRRGEPQTQTSWMVHSADTGLAQAASSLSLPGAAQLAWPALRATDVLVMMTDGPNRLGRFHPILTSRDGGAGSGARRLRRLLGGSLASGGLLSRGVVIDASGGLAWRRRGR